MTDTWHDTNFQDCGTKHFVTYHIDNKKKLYMIDGRHYYLLNGNVADYSELKTINAEIDTNLIGTSIALRSPVTCLGNKPGKHICKTCYGAALAEINKNLHTGLVSVLLLTNVQKMSILNE